MISKNIFLYWEQKDIPLDIINNLLNWKKHNLNFNVKLINSYYIEQILKQHNETLLNLFNKITIPSCKSDIARCVLLYYEGGIYVDSNTITLSSISEIYEQYKNYDFVLSYNYENTDFSTQTLFSNKNCEFLKNVIDVITFNLKELYLKEQNTNEYVNYNILVLTGTFPFMQVLDYDFVSPRNITKNTYINNIKKYNIGFFDTNNNIIKHYGCNINFHHNINFHNHWSNLQKKQKLFSI